jgi:hypothetical protein
MILYYALGEGLGHLTRARAVVHTLDLRDQLAVLTSLSQADAQRILPNAEIVSVLEDRNVDRRAWLGQLLQCFRPSEIYVDSFPVGLFGELCDLADLKKVPVFHLARLLSWKEYNKFVQARAPRFARTYVLEPLTDDHEQYLARQSDEIKPLALHDPPERLSETAEERITELKSRGRPLWMIVHSGPDDEVYELLSYAEETARMEAIQPQILLVAPRPFPDERLALDCTHWPYYPAALLFPFADRIITACGFNAMRQTMPYRRAHRYLPFMRRFDDQFLRAARTRS